jgi:16S rRNA (uracil1498-N3)-methyltransferase
MTRIYLTQNLNEAQIVELDKDKRHYLERVLRFKQDDCFLGFNEKDGEWKIIFQNAQYQCVARVRKPLETEVCWLAFSPLKHDPMNFLIEKATELGVTDLQPIVCDRTNTHRLNIHRLEKNVIEAAQQCERFDVPAVHAPIKLQNFLQGLPKEVNWYVALERESIAIEKIKYPAGFIVGPEGGWSPQERSILKKYANLISLGSNVLRAETAALACLSSRIWSA